MNRKMVLLEKLPRLTPGRYLLLGFAIVIVVGAACLMLPISQSGEAPTTWIDALFTSTSAVCVTGLSVVVTASHWSVFGQWVILALIEIGGLGFMSFTTMFMILLGRRITLRARMRIQESMNQSVLSGGVRLVKRIFRASLGIQLIGATLLSLRFIPEYGMATGIYYGVFHAVSAFCNAGFDILGDASLYPYATDFYVNAVIAAMIVLGGLGYFVWADLYRIYRLRREKNWPLRRLCHSLTLQSKLVLLITGFLLLTGFLIFLLLEWSNPETLGPYGVFDKMVIAAFQSVTLRTAGFSTIAQGGLRGASKFIASIWMFIGAASGGTAGGIKVATVGVLMLTIYSEIIGRKHPHVFGRQIGEAVIRKAMAIFGISFLFLILFTIAVSIQEPFEFMDVLYETVSALSTTGLSTGITGSLGAVSRCILIAAMYIGRTGSLTLAAALQKHENGVANEVRYPEESIMVG